jgi:hypothetical protein
MARRRRGEPAQQDPTEIAEAAGKKYAEDQLASDYFHDWVWEQMVEGAKMERARPGSTIDDPGRIARNILDQLRWDIHRDMNAREVLPLIDIGDQEAPDHELVKAFFAGLDEELHSKAARDWLTTFVQEVMADAKGRTQEIGTIIPSTYPREIGTVIPSTYRPTAEEARRQPVSGSRGRQYHVHVITHGLAGPPIQHAPVRTFRSIRDARAHGEAEATRAPHGAEVSIGDPHGNKLEILNRRSGQWHVQPNPARESVVRDYIAVDNHGRTIGGPYTDYSKAKREADQAGGYVQFATRRPPSARERRLREASTDSPGEISTGTLVWYTDGWWAAATGSTRAGTYREDAVQARQHDTPNTIPKWLAIQLKDWPQPLRIEVWSMGRWSPVPLHEDPRDHGYDPDSRAGGRLPRLRRVSTPKLLPPKS